MDPTSKEFAQRAAQGQAGKGQDHLDKATPIHCEYKYKTFLSFSLEKNIFKFKTIFIFFR